MAEETGRPFPQHLAVQCDNTTAQNKNSLVRDWLAHLVSEGKLLTATMHTHEDVDHYFSVILSTVLRPNRFELPEHLAESFSGSLESSLWRLFTSGYRCWYPDLLGLVLLGF